jgi:hypothetical protein
VKGDGSPVAGKRLAYERFAVALSEAQQQGLDMLTSPQSIYGEIRARAVILK